MIERGRPRSHKLLTSLISDWQYGGTGTSTSPETEEFEATHPSLETEKRRRQFTLAVRTACSRLPELERGPIAISLNWWIEEDLAKRIYADAVASDIDITAGPPFGVVEVARSIAEALLQHGEAHFDAQEFDLENLGEDVSSWLNAHWEGCWKDLHTYFRDHCCDLTRRWS
jgi:hypothetical protein